MLSAFMVAAIRARVSETLPLAVREAPSCGAWRASSDADAFDLGSLDDLVGPIVDFGGAGVVEVGDALGRLEAVAALELGGDAGRTTGVIADLVLQPGRPHALLDHGQGAAAVEPPRRQASTRAAARATALPMRIVQDGSLILGHMAPGRYLLRVWQDGRAQDPRVDIAAAARSSRCDPQQTFLYLFTVVGSAFILLDRDGRCSPSSGDGEPRSLGTTASEGARDADIT